MQHTSTSNDALLVFQPLFSVTVIETSRNGNSIGFILCVVKEEDGSELKCVRDFEDLEFLHSCLTSHNEHEGYIIPPLPTHPEIEAKNMEAKSKRRFGAETKIVSPNFYSCIAANVERYFDALTKHSLFGTHPALVSFLTNYQLPQRDKVRKTLIGRMSSVVYEAWKSTHKDIDEYFQTCRAWVTDYSAALTDANATLGKLTDSETRVASSYSEFEKAFLLDGGMQTLNQLRISQISIKLAEALEDMKRTQEASCCTYENTLGLELAYYSRYFDNLKEMLFRRTCLLIEYENANKYLEKCKPAKKDEAKVVKEKAEAAYDNCTEILKTEIKKFDEVRLVAYKTALVKLCESQVKSARDTYALLLKTTNEIKLT